MTFNCRKILCNLMRIPNWPNLIVRIKVTSLEASAFNVFFDMRTRGWLYVEYF